MTLAGAILKKVQSDTSVRKKYSSPPPETEEIEIVVKKKKKRRMEKFAHVRPTVNTSPPRLDPSFYTSQIPEWRSRLFRLYEENIALLRNIRHVHFNKGKVDSRWKVYPPRTLLYYLKRVDFYTKVQRDNKLLHDLIVTTECRVVPTSELRRDWRANRRLIVYGAQAKFVLFPPIPQETVEDHAFIAPSGIKRPRVYLTLRVRNCAEMGDLTAELFTDVCPKTCQLFMDLVMGDGVGYGYIGTCFFRKVPGLFWSGGDVVHDCGYGCYAQKGRTVPIGAENFHFSHSMPGLLSMRVTQDDEVCGIFNITFKPLPQLDLRNVVFGRIVRPCSTYDSIINMGSAVSTWPIVEVVRTRHRTTNGWVCGTPNTKLYDAHGTRMKLRQT